MLDHVLQFDVEVERFNKWIVKKTLHLLGHKVSGFDSYSVLNKLPQRKTAVSLIKTDQALYHLKFLIDM